MLIGKLAENLSLSYSKPKLASLSYNTYKIPNDSSSGTLETTTPESEGIIKINNEELLYKRVSAGDEGVFYELTRGYRNTPIEAHLIGDLIFSIAVESTRKYESRNIYTIKVNNYGLEIANLGLTTAYGFDAIVQNIKLALQSAANDIISQSSSVDISPSLLKARYEQVLANNNLIVDNIIINEIKRHSDDPNRLDVSLKVQISNFTSNNIQTVIFINRANI